MRNQVFREIDGSGIPPIQYQAGVQEFCNIRIPAGIADSQVESLQIRLESNGRKFSASENVSPSQHDCLISADPDDPNVLSAHLVSSTIFEDKPKCVVNGKAAECTSMTAFALSNTTWAYTLTVRTSDPFRLGDRLVLSADFGRNNSFLGATRAFHAFALGKSEYELGLRPTDVSYSPEGIWINLVNESDFRKPSVRIHEIWVNGSDVTNVCDLPDGDVPPDRRNHANSRRVRIPRVAGHNRQLVEIRYKWVSVETEDPLPAGYFALQKTSFETQEGIPYGIEVSDGFGVNGGACVLYGGLDSVPLPSGFAQRVSRVSMADSSIPVFASLPRAISISRIQAMADQCDFLVLGQPFVVGNLQNDRGKDFVRGFAELQRIPGSAAASIVLENSPLTSKRDIQWLAWSAIGEGSRGLLLSNSNEGEIDVAAGIDQYIAETLEEISRLSSQLSRGVRLPVQLHCDQQGIRCRALCCGADEILIVLISARPEMGFGF